ncbi:MAG: hypothetical protein IPN76_29300 [Saprospiraceae bacterium]|nr:hypothetical protein [Saprospiraceae bacterium]
MGLFDRPISKEVIAVADPSLNLSDALAVLRRHHLIFEESRHDPEEVDCHPLIREHFEELFQKEQSEQWKAAHGALYEYYKALPEKLYGKYLPDTLEEMEYLYQAVVYGCKAELHPEVLDEIYSARIRRRLIAYSFKLGAFSSDLAALSHFFEKPWEKPVQSLGTDWQAVTLSWAGYCFKSLGKLYEATITTKSAFEIFVEREEWSECSLNASNLSEMFLLRGDVKKAILYGRKSSVIVEKENKWKSSVVCNLQYGNALYHANKIKEAKKYFLKAEYSLQSNGKIKYLYPYQSFFYCEILIEKGGHKEAIIRAKSALKIANELGLLSASMWKLNLGKIYNSLQETGILDSMFEDAIQNFNQSIIGIRTVGHLEYLPFGLLAAPPTTATPTTGKPPKKTSKKSWTSPSHPACASTSPTTTSKWQGCASHKPDQRMPART